ncbi:non-muscle caldesmon-like isoform X2 [Hippocampus comes]|uniref:non-muscle caldesmon-like isoform X2 n=1 Tax=Hippocampus comes TaxID=109280 RepID=UPI00094E8369|nr:PREDICTED: non-muscle caldesmon-like isoform X2 [Hippocampus comes]
MSAALLRRNSSRQGLQNLIRLTAQRSVEDAEEAERERRRRARDQSCRRNSDAAPAERAADPTDDQHASKPGRSPSPSPEEDEGFGDWTQRRQQSGPQRPPEGAEGWRPEDEDRRNGDAFEAAPEDPRPAPSGIWAPSSSARVRCGEEGEGGKPRPQTDRPDSLRRSQVEERQPTRVPSTAKVFLLRDSKADADAGQREVTSRHTGDQSKSKSPRCAERGETEAGLEAERRLEKIRQGLREKESQELEQLKRRHARAEQELEELAGRRELRRRLRSQEERRQQDERRQRLANEEEEHERMKEEVARRRMDAAERMKMLSGGDPPEAFSPVKTPTHKMTERTESLSRSLKKSNSFKKMPAVVLVSNIDDKMEQYAHAVENSQEPRGSKAPATNLPNALEAVNSKKVLFEAGEARTGGPPKTTTCRDTDSLKVGVANLITQWVKGQPDGGRPPPSRAAVSSGDGANAFMLS